MTKKTPIDVQLDAQLQDINEITRAVGAQSLLAAFGVSEAAVSTRLLRRLFPWDEPSRSKV